jgi:hypothetical protein
MQICDLNQKNDAKIRIKYEIGKKYEKLVETR